MLASLNFYPVGQMNHTLARVIVWTLKVDEPPNPRFRFRVCLACPIYTSDFNKRMALMFLANNYVFPALVTKAIFNLPFAFGFRKLGMCPLAIFSNDTITDRKESIGRDF